MSHKLLLADDSLTIQKVVELTFSRADFELRTVGSGDKAVALLEEFQPDVVLADAVMPGLTGYEVCEAVKRTPGGAYVPVVLLTGTFEPFDRTRAERVGCDSIVTKPFDSHALVTLVRNLVEKARIARETAPPPPPPEPEAQQPAFVEDLLSDVPAFSEAPAFASGSASPVFTEESIFVEESSFSPELAFEPEPPAPPEPDLYATSAIQIPSLEELQAMEERKRQVEAAPEPEPEPEAEPFAPESVAPPMAVTTPTPGEVPFDEQVTAELAKPAAEELALVSPPPPEAEPAAFELEQEPPVPVVPPPMEADETEGPLTEPIDFEPPRGDVRVEELPAAEPVAEELPPAPFDMETAAPEEPAFEEAPAPLETAESGPEPELAPLPVELLETTAFAGPEPFPLDEPPVLTYEDEGVESPHGDIEEAIAAYEREHPSPAGHRRLDEEEEAAAPVEAEPEPLDVVSPVPAGDLEALAAQADLKALIPQAALNASATSAGGTLSDSDVDRIARRVVELLGERVLRDVAWEVVPEMAERLVRARLAELEG